MCTRRGEWDLTKNWHMSPLNKRQQMHTTARKKNKRRRAFWDQRPRERLNLYIAIHYNSRRSALKAFIHFHQVYEKKSFVVVVVVWMLLLPFKVGLACLDQFGLWRLRREAIWPQVMLRTKRPWERQTDISLPPPDDWLSFVFVSQSMDHFSIFVRGSPQLLTVGFELEPVLLFSRKWSKWVGKKREEKKVLPSKQEKFLLLMRTTPVYYAYARTIPAGLWPSLAAAETIFMKPDLIDSGIFNSGRFCQFFFHRRRLQTSISVSCHVPSTISIQDLVPHWAKQNKSNEIVPSNALASVSQTWVCLCWKVKLFLTWPGLMKTNERVKATTAKFCLSVCRWWQWISISNAKRIRQKTSGLVFLMQTHKQILQQMAKVLKNGQRRESIFEQ